MKISHSAPQPTRPANLVLFNLMTLSVKVSIVSEKFGVSLTFPSAHGETEKMDFKIMKRYQLNVFVLFGNTCCVFTIRASLTPAPLSLPLLALLSPVANTEGLR